MDIASIGDQADMLSADEAKAYIMGSRLQRWPKIPRPGFAVTRYEVIAAGLVRYRTLFDVCENECRVTESVFGLELRFENGTVHWMGRRILLFENPHRTKVFRLLTKMWRTRRLLPASRKRAYQRYRLARLITNLEEALLESPERLDLVAAQSRAFLEKCPELLRKPDRHFVSSCWPITLKPEGMPGFTPKKALPWPKGF